MNFDDNNFKIAGKLLASCYSKLSYREGIKLPINEDSIAEILIAIHV